MIDSELQVCTPNLIDTLPQWPRLPRLLLLLTAPSAAIIAVT
jgi:hypothetical protein